MPILFGTGEILQGLGKGIHIYKIDIKSGQLSNCIVNENIDNPSFLAVNKKSTRIYAVNELKEFRGEKSGAISAFSIDKSTGIMTLLNQKPTGGQDPCYLCFDKDEHHILISNFMTGSICVYNIESDGSLGKQTCFIQHVGFSVNKARQLGPHAHAITFSPDFSRAYVPDLGIDKVVVYRFDDVNGCLYEDKENDFICKPGSGPRYCEFHPDLPVCYLIQEISSQVTVLRWDKTSGKMSMLQTVNTLPSDFYGENTCADLHISTNGSFLFASNRGHNSIARFAIDNSTGRLSFLGHTPSGGRTPRHFTLAPQGRFILVGNQDSDCITVFTLDSDTGELVKVQSMYAPTPVCLKFI